jgi:hypothetical protein
VRFICSLWKCSVIAIDSGLFDMHGNLASQLLIQVYFSVWKRIASATDCNLLSCMECSVSVIDSGLFIKKRVKS